MNKQQYDIASMIGSRICHDLISPLGAIGNGVELLSMLDGVEGPEMAMINQSVLNANARIRFFRISFGAASGLQLVSKAEIISILQDISHGGRINIDWRVSEDVPRDRVKLAFLLLQCLESAMPYGGNVTVDFENAHWKIHAMSERMKINSDIWGVLVNQNTTQDILPADVHFAIAYETALQSKALLQTDLRENEIMIRY